MSVVSISHTDLDGVSCQIVLNQTFSDVITLNSSYSKVMEYLEILEDTLNSRNTIKEVYVSDINLQENEMQVLRRLSDTHSSLNFYYIDHHEYDYEPTTYKSSNLHIIVSESFSATKLMYGFLKRNKNLNPSPELTNYVNIVDAYDLWRLDDPLFKQGLAFNEIFWSYKLRAFYVRFKDNHKFRQQDKELVHKLYNKKTKLFDKLIKSGRIFQAQNKSVCLCFLDDFRSHITLDFPDFYVYVNMTTFGTISIRLSKGFTDDEAKFIKDSLVAYLENHQHVDTAGGHVRAFGATTKVGGDATKIVNLGREISIKADELMEHQLNLYSGDGAIAR